LCPIRPGRSWHFLILVCVGKQKSFSKSRDRPKSHSIERSRKRLERSGSSRKSLNLKSSESEVEVKNSLGAFKCIEAILSHLNRFIGY
jgi:hypothetical protein